MIAGQQSMVDWETGGGVVQKSILWSVYMSVRVAYFQSLAISERCIMNAMAIVFYNARNRSSTSYRAVVWPDEPCLDPEAFHIVIHRGKDILSVSLFSN